MTKNVEVSNINIKIGKKEVLLTLEEAKELKELLNKTFGDKETVYIPQPYPVYDRPWRWSYWDVYCSYNNDSYTIDSDTGANGIYNTTGGSCNITYSLNSAEAK